MARAALQPIERFDAAALHHIGVAVVRQQSEKHITQGMRAVCRGGKRLLIGRQSKIGERGKARKRFAARTGQAVLAVKACAGGVALPQFRLKAGTNRADVGRQSRPIALLLPRHTPPQRRRRNTEGK